MPWKIEVSNYFLLLATQYNRSIKPVGTYYEVYMTGCEQLEVRPNGIESGLFVFA